MNDTGVQKETPAALLRRQVHLLEAIHKVEMENRQMLVQMQQAPQKIKIDGFTMTFSQWINLLLLIALASIPASIILFIIFAVLSGVLGAMLGFLAFL